MCCLYFSLTFILSFYLFYSLYFPSYTLFFYPTNSLFYSSSFSLSATLPFTLPRFLLFCISLCLSSPPILLLSLFSTFPLPLTHPYILSLTLVFFFPFYNTRHNSRSTSRFSLYRYVLPFNISQILPHLYLFLTLLNSLRLLLLLCRVHNIYFICYNSISLTRFNHPFAILAITQAPLFDIPLCLLPFLLCHFFFSMTVSCPRFNTILIIILDPLPPSIFCFTIFFLKSLQLFLFNAFFPFPFPFLNIPPTILAINQDTYSIYLSI